MGFSARVSGYVEGVEQALAACLPAADTEPARLYEAMRYAVLQGGKRMRPLLAYAAGEALSIPPTRLHPIACALELIHAYSLVHDDLPAMDDDDLRRGKPSLHKAFDEATAILVGDALQTLAFQVLATAYKAADTDVQLDAMILSLAEAAGAGGMVGGQLLDILAEHEKPTQADVEQMFRLKTGQLIRASVILPCYCVPDVAPEIVKNLSEYADALGVAFQIWDDVLDVEGKTDVIGKPAGSDQAHGKASYPACFGLDASKQRVFDLHQAALAGIEGFGEAAEGLRWMAQRLIFREA